MCTDIYSQKLLHRPNILNSKNCKFFIGLHKYEKMYLCLIFMYLIISYLFIPFICLLHNELFCTVKHLQRAFTLISSLFCGDSYNESKESAAK